MAFTLFPPLGAKVKNVITVPLPWLHPLMDGRGGSKKSGKNFSLSEGCEHSERHDNVVPSASPSKIPDFQEFPTQNLLIQQPSITFHLQHFFLCINVIKRIFSCHLFEGLNSGQSWFSATFAFEGKEGKQTFTGKWI